MVAASRVPKCASQHARDRAIAVCDARRERLAWESLLLIRAPLCRSVVDLTSSICPERCVWRVLTRLRRCRRRILRWRCRSRSRRVVHEVRIALLDLLLRGGSWWWCQVSHSRLVGPVLAPVALQVQPLHPAPLSAICCGVSVLPTQLAEFSLTVLLTTSDTGIWAVPVGASRI